MTDSTPGTARNRSKRNRISRNIGAVVAAATLGLAAACSSDSVTAPQMNHNSDGGLTGIIGGTVSKLLNVTGLMRDNPLRAAIVRSAVITQKDGGTIKIDGTGFELNIPKGAIPVASMTITVTALPGAMVAYDFQPHGTKFLLPLSIRQDLNGSNWNHLGFQGVVKGGYFKDISQLDMSSCTALLDETFPVTVSSSRLSFNIMHFSGYMVATGRADAPAEPF